MKFLEVMEATREVFAFLSGKGAMSILSEAPSQGIKCQKA